MLKDEIERAKMYDANAVFWGYPISQLMENAGEGIARFIAENYTPGKVGFFCGPGNNGGDGMVASRYLPSSFESEIYLVPLASHIKSKAVLNNWERLNCAKHENISPDVIFDHFDIVVECLFGTGIEGQIREPYQSVISRLNEIDGKKISIDALAPCFEPEKILSLMTQKTKGAEVIDIGYPEWLKKRIGPGEVKVLNKPDPSSHKGQNGKILIIGGNERYHGAVLLAAQIASKIVDLVYISSVERNNRLVENLKSEMAEFISVNRSEVEDFVEEADVVLMGPGLGRDENVEELVNSILENNPSKKTVLDADALGIVKKRNLHKNVLLTPHAGEFEELFGMEPEKENAKKAASEFGGVVLLKGETDIVSDGEEIKLNCVGNAGMTKGGTGDILAGLSTALASNNSLYLSARVAAFINGLAADRLKREVSYYFNASDLVEEIPRTIKWCEEYYSR